MTTEAKVTKCVIEQEFSEGRTKHTVKLYYIVTGDDKQHIAIGDDGNLIQALNAAFSKMLKDSSIENGSELREQHLVIMNGKVQATLFFHVEDNGKSGQKVGVGIHDDLSIAILLALTDFCRKVKQIEVTVAI